MKKIVITFCLFSSLITLAQQSPLLEHAWTIEKIVTELEIINADPGADGTYDQIQFYYSEFNDEYFYELEEFRASIEFDDDVQDFEILNLEYPIGLYGSDISQFFHFTFLTESLPSANLVQQPLSYSFLEEGDLIAPNDNAYIMVTNSVTGVNHNFMINNQTNTVDIPLHYLTVGAYIVNLVIDGNIIDTKHLIKL